MNSLSHRDEFQRVLAAYTPSDSAKQSLAQTKLVLLVGPTSSGRNTIIGELLKTGKYHQIVSDTTRQPRSNNGLLEQNGKEYWFRDEADLLADLQNGDFLEAAIIHEQQVSGISIRELQSAAAQGKIAINEIEVVGADNIHTANPGATFFFVIPPSFDEWMFRMTARGQLPADEIRRRLESAVQEIGTALGRSYYHFIINDTFTHAARRIDDMVSSDLPAHDQAKAKDMAGRLLNDTKAHLQQLT